MRHAHMRVISGAGLVTVLVCTALSMAELAEDGVNPFDEVSPTLFDDLFEWEDDPVEEAAEDALAVTPAMAAMFQGMTLAQDELYDEAIPLLEQAIEKDPTLIGAWSSLGWAYWSTDRREEAEDLWNRLVTIAPNEPTGYNLLAQVATREAEFERAAELYITSLELEPEQYDIRLNLARVWLWGGQYRKAVRLLQTLFAEDPDRIDVEIELAWALYTDEQYEEAIVHWNNINEWIPDNPTFLLARANVWVLLGDLDAARADAEQVLEIDARNLEAMNILANLAVRGKRPEEAVTRLRQLMDYTDEDSAKAELAMRIAVYMKSILDQGSDLFSRAQILRVVRISLDYDDSVIGTHLFYGEMLAADRQFAAAEEVFQRVLDEFNPYARRALFGLVETYLGRSQLDRAEAQLRENYNVLNANDPFRHLYWARLCLARGEVMAALDALDRLEYEGSQGAVFTLLYGGISPSEFSHLPSARQVRAQLMTLRRAGFQFITPSELPSFFDQKEPANRLERRPWLNRVVNAARYAWTGERREKQTDLSDYSPEMVAMLTFDGGFRNSFRYGTQIMDDLGIQAAMFVGAGDVLSPDHREVASFEEIREFHAGGQWEIHSRLWAAGQLAALSEDETEWGLPLVNRVWLPEAGRLETLREYQVRVRREFRQSRAVLAQELGIDEEKITSVGYPEGEIGQEGRVNIEAFRVPDVVLNEADTVYRQGFMQHEHGYSLKTDDALWLKRWQPDRQATARDVLRAAYRQHPVFQARRMRAEIAALTGRLHLALEQAELLKRDGYPEEDLADVNSMIHRHLGRLAALPEVAEDLRGADGEPEGFIALRRPHIGVEGQITRANIMIDDREASIFGGLYVNRRTGLQVRAGRGRIKQTVETNRFVEVQETSRSSQRVEEERIENGEVTRSRSSRITVETRTVLSNQVERTRFDADKDFVGLALNHTHPSGSFTLGEVRRYTYDGSNIDDETAYTFALEHQWRPVLAIDMAARYHRGIVPSAREVLQFDSLGVRAIWRIRDYWHANGLAYFAYYEDRNSLLKGELENLWQLSERYDVWFGVENMVDTVDRDSDLYWTPFWDQRHALLLRLRRSYPNYFGMVRAHIGVQKSRVRREERDAFATALARGEAEGWSPGAGPRRGWERMIGFAGTVSRTFESGLKLSTEFSVNATDEYTEHTVSGSALYTF